MARSGFVMHGVHPTKPLQHWLCKPTSLLKSMSAQGVGKPGQLSVCAALHSIR